MINEKELAERFSLDIDKLILNPAAKITPAGPLPDDNGRSPRTMPAHEPEFPSALRECVPGMADSGNRCRKARILICFDFNFNRYIILFCITRSPFSNNFLHINRL